ncbi:MAG: hypothetical protein ACQCN5_01475 [Candidatus Bathyarchaeia archaeon]|jgi:hypothetical protein
MKCTNCGNNLEENQVYTFQGKTVCEDCCFDLMNPPRVCDPTAVSQTLMIRKNLGHSGTEGLSDLQKKIFDTVVAAGTIPHGELLAKLGLNENEFQKEFAVLRHCELLRAFKEGNAVYLAKFEK